MLQEPWLTTFKQIFSTTYKDSATSKDESLLFAKLTIDDLDTGVDVVGDAYLDPYGLKNVGKENPEEKSATTYEVEGRALCSGRVKSIDEVLAGPPSARAATWEEFYYRKTMHRKLSRLLSERPYQYFDSLLFDLEKVDDGRNSSVIPLTLFVSCLSNLAFGRESIMYRFHRGKIRFDRELPDTQIRVPGCSATIVNEISHQSLVCGSRLQRLRYTLDTIRQSNKPNPTLIAFADCIHLVVKTIDKHGGDLHQCQQLLGLEKLIEQPSRIIKLLTTVLGCADIGRTVELNRLPSPTALLNALYSRCQIFEKSDQILFRLVRIIFQRTSQPWLENLEDLIGLGKTERFWQTKEHIASFEGNFVKMEGDSIKLDENEIPIFLDRKTANKVRQTLTCLVMYSEYGDRKVNLRLYSMHKIRIEWKFYSRELQARLSEVKAYADNGTKMLFTESFVHSEPIIETVVSFNNNLLLWPEDCSYNVADQLCHAIRQLDRIERSKDGDEIERICEHIIVHDGGEESRELEVESVPIYMIPQLCLGNIIQIQSQITNSLIIQMLNQDNELNINDHTLLIRQVYLLGSGDLLVRLEESIFSESCNGGLHLDTREIAWPPSTAQLNQAVSDAVEQITLGLEIGQTVAEGDFLNFGPREHREGEEMGLIHNPYSIRATDVLRLCYNVPAPLALIINDKVLDMLDLIFRRLLRLLRVQHELKRLRNKQFIEARHFVYALTNHVVLVIQYHWKEVEKTVSQQQSLQEIIDCYRKSLRSICTQTFIETDLENDLDNILESVLQLCINDNQISLVNTLHDIICSFIDSLKPWSITSGPIVQQLLLTLNYNGYYE